MLLEVLSTVAQLPLHNVEDMPCARLRPHRPQEAKNILEAAEEKARGMMLVGSDRSVAAILHARDRFRKCSDLFQHMQKTKVSSAREVTPSSNESSAEATPVKLGHASKPTKARGKRKPLRGEKQTALNESEISEMFCFSTADGTELGINLPCEVSLNAATFEDLAPFLSGALVVTRVPSEAHRLGCTARMARLYRDFGHFLAARKDNMVGAFVLVDNPVFRRQTRLAWQTLGHFRAANQRRWWLLYWSALRPHGHGGHGGHGETDAEWEQDQKRFRRWERSPRRRTLQRRRGKHET